MLDQYRRIKREHQGAVLFFRLGDFYEMFAEDALEVSALLNLTLTSRTGLPMCGVPYHASRSYIARLLKYGKKIAICEQLSEAGKGKGLMERQVTEVITPGTAVDEDYLDKGSANYLSALASKGSLLSFAYMDLSTGEFRATSFPLENGGERLGSELERLQPREMVIQESLLEENTSLARVLSEYPGLVLNRWADWLFDSGRGRELLERQFGSGGLKAFGLSGQEAEIAASGALLDYLTGTSRSMLPHVRSLICYGDEEYIGIDESSQRNLELIRNLRDGDVHFSLLEVIDETKTAMGRRLLKQRLLHPLRNIGLIEARLNLTESLYRDQRLLSALRDILASSPDLQRLCSRLAMDKAHARDMAALKNSLASLFICEEKTAGRLPGFESQGARSIDAGVLALMNELKERLEQGIADDPSVLLTEGNLIRGGYSAELDGLKSLRDNGRSLVEAYLEEERAATGIPSLKIRYNRLIGYYFEVTNNHLDKVPRHFIRRQGIAGGERYTTDRLSSLEADINGAQDKIIELEKKLFLELREGAKALLPLLISGGEKIAELDAALSLARAATIRGWVRPVVDEKNRILIREGRHPVVEAHLGSGEFVPNDTSLDGGGKNFVLITGPNMAGKSTYLRQTALMVILAQMGSFVPAREAAIGLVDRIYCRVGAQDNLARGESTFLVEMNETAYILNTATEKSLVIMDEVGRGTGTKDGLSIAWAVCEELLDRIHCRTLFATHYHELSMINHQRMTNRSMEVMDRDGELVFLRHLIEGAAAESYGLEVARLAGISAAVLSRARELLDAINENEKKLGKLPVSGHMPPRGGQYAAAVKRQGETSREEAQVLKDLRSLDVERLSPLDALNLLHLWKTLVSGTEGSRNRIQAPEMAVLKKNTRPLKKESPELFDSY
ncbi:MAG: DNA mismatch repair protein MutS [Spirochaetaceae bacterium]|jgi:DNA mismatch repair protein MutS|nr:DNA mismatch repair protein MutS [Spirochaetaceae bacterium]